ncbi:MAG: calcium-binding protein, partial [Gemmobacter sp.]|nr:calcium-binding protein [Gemmobacter sp.]
GNDTYVLEDAGDQIIEAIDGGIDTVESLLATTTLVANVENLRILFAGAANGTGNDLDNGMTGNNWANRLDGGAGNDLLLGMFGDDSLYGGTGNDTVDGGFGSDRLFGGIGDDVVLGGEGIDWLYGEDGNDALQGGNGNDLAYGGNGNDTVSGDAGNDYLAGGAGNDEIRGGDGNDTIRGDGGTDLLYGGAGADVFQFFTTADSQTSGFDRIMDFTRGEDRIDLSPIDADTTIDGNQRFYFSAARPFFSSPGDVWTRSTLLGAVVEGDVNGDGVADFRILVVGVNELSASEFYL